MGHTPPIPVGTQHGDVVRVRGGGVVRSAGGGQLVRGDHRVTVALVLPSADSLCARSRERLAQLARLATREGAVRT